MVNTASPRYDGLVLTEIEQRLLQALNDLEAASAVLKTAQPKPDLVSLFARVDALAAQLPPDADPELRHFLQRKSYPKARQRLLHLPCAAFKPCRAGG